MALEKEIILNNGIVANYHKVSSVHCNFIENKTIIKVDSYVSKEIREGSNKLNEIQSTINALTAQAIQAEEKGDTDLSISLNQKISHLYVQLTEISNTKYEAGYSTIELDSIPEDISLTGIYKLLKATELYSKAKKV